MPDSAIEIITGRERRRRWSLQEKLRIVVETHEPGASVRGVAARHDVYPNLLSTWRHQVRTGRLGTTSLARFVPVCLSEPTPAPAATAQPVQDHPANDTIEIVLPDGSRVRVGSGVNLNARRRVVNALRG